MFWYGLNIGTLTLFNMCFMIITITLHHYNCSILPLISSSIFLYLSTFSSCFSINISTSSSASVPYTPYRLLISCSSRHYIKFLTVSSSPAHSKQSTSPPSKPCSTSVSGYWFFIETTGLNHIHYCKYPHPHVSFTPIKLQCCFTLYIPSPPVIFPVVYFPSNVICIYPPHIRKVQSQFP